MDLKLQFGSTQFHLSSSSSSYSSTKQVILLNKTHPNLVFLPLHRYNQTKRRKKPKFHVSASSNPDGSGWTRFSQYFNDSLKKETGFDLKDANVKLSGFVGRVQDSVSKTRTEFLNWNEWQRWKVISS